MNKFARYDRWMRCRVVRLSSGEGRDEERCWPTPFRVRQSVKSRARSVKGHQRRGFVCVVWQPPLPVISLFPLRYEIASTFVEPATSYRSSDTRVIRIASVTFPEIDVPPTRQYAEVNDFRNVWIIHVVENYANGLNVGFRAIRRTYWFRDKFAMVSSLFSANTCSYWERARTILTRVVLFGSEFHLVGQLFDTFFFFPSSLVRPKEKQ